MPVLETEKPFKPPLPRPEKEIWQASYQLNQSELLEAVELAIQRVAPPTLNLPWQYDGYRSNRIYFFHRCYGFPNATAELGMKLEGNQITIYANTASELELQLFRRLTTELDSLEQVASKRLTPCTFVGMADPQISYLWP